MKTLTGKVISAKMSKTATVLVAGYRRHPLYGKILKRNIKIHAANKIGAKANDNVIIKEIRPLAKTVTFEITEIIKEKQAVPKTKKEKK